MSKKKLKVDSTIKIRAYGVISDMVEAAVDLGYNRAHKHTSTPDKDHVIQCIRDAVMSDLCAVLDFGDN